MDKSSNMPPIVLRTVTMEPLCCIVAIKVVANKSKYHAERKVQDEESPTEKLLLETKLMLSPKRD